MIENISALIGNSKMVRKIYRRRLNDTPPSESSIEEAKAKVQKILEEGVNKKRKKKTSDKK